MDYSQDSEQPVHQNNYVLQDKDDDSGTCSMVVREKRKTNERPVMGTS
jgi:hypothetical protein